jgi:arylsulfatase A-like enzyme
MTNCSAVLFAAGVLSGTALAAAPAVPAQPNIVFLLADDLGYGDLGCYGAADIRTPVIDRLARTGVRFTNFYSNGPECSPTRAGLLTGRYQQRVGGLECAIGNGNVGRYDDAIRLRAAHDLGLPVEETSIARLLKNVGYATGIVGKWHLGYEPKFAPNLHGFDHAFVSLGGGMDYFHHVEEPPVYTSVLQLNGRPIRRDGYFTDLIADEAERFIADNRTRPFFLYVPFTAPHAPFQGPDDRQPQPLPADSPLWKQPNGPPLVYAAMIERMDAAIGRILATLENHGIAGRTLVIFHSDNGGTASARHSGLRNIKGTTFEGGIRVPCIVRWPNVLPEETTTAQAAITMDLTTSIARIAGAKPAAGRAFDGIDILARLAGRQPEIPRTLFWRNRRGESAWKAVRDGSLKYVLRTVGDKTSVEGLFDLDSDRGEASDLLAARPADAARLRQLLATWEETVQPRR